MFLPANFMGSLAHTPAAGLSKHHDPMAEIRRLTSPSRAGSVTANSSGTVRIEQIAAAPIGPVRPDVVAQRPTRPMQLVPIETNVWQDGPCRVSTVVGWGWTEI